MGDDIKQAHGYQRRDANKRLRSKIEEILISKALKASGSERAERLFGAKELARQEADKRIPMGKEAALSSGEVRHLKSAGELSSWTEHHKLSSSPEERTAVMQSLNAAPVVAAPAPGPEPQPEPIDELERMELFAETRRSIREELPPEVD